MSRTLRTMCVVEPSCQGVHYGQVSGQRRIVGVDRAADSQTCAQRQGRASAGFGSGLFHRNLFVLKTGIPWEDFPQEMGGCGMTLWCRLRDWQKAGVWQKLHELLLAKLRAAE